MISVDLIINCYEKTQKVLDKSFIYKVLDQNKYKFKNIFIVVNNVKDKKGVVSKVSKLKKKRVINDYFFVEDYIDDVLKLVKLKKEDLEPIPHYTDWALVSLYIAKSEYLLHWDPDVYLERPVDWITPSIKKLDKNKNFIIASPLWGFQKSVIKHESYDEDEEFSYNKDFSDQIFLTKKENLLKPIYKYNHIYSLRFPLAHIGSTFEKRIDGYMKKKNKTRLIFKEAVYVHPQDSGSPYPNVSIFRIILHYIFMVIVVTYYYFFLSFRKTVLKQDK